MTIPAREVRLTQWGTSLGIRIPKEFTDLFNLRHRSLVQIVLKDGALQMKPINSPHVRKPLSEILTEAKTKSIWDGKPADITDEDRQWLDMSSVGEEVIPYE